MDGRNKRETETWKCLSPSTGNCVVCSPRPLQGWRRHVGGESATGTRSFLFDWLRKPAETKFSIGGGRTNKRCDIVLGSMFRVSRLFLPSMDPFIDHESRSSLASVRRFLQTGLLKFAFVHRSDVFVKSSSVKNDNNTFPLHASNF